MATMAPERWRKSPTEAKIFEFEVPEIDLATGETISTADVTSTPAGVTWGSEAINGRFVQSKATGGTLGLLYHATLVVNTSLGQTLEYCGSLVIENC